MLKGHKIAVIIPCYRVRKHILRLVSNIPEFVDTIYIVDDKCPEKTGELVKKSCKDSRVHLISHKENQGVGQATITGMKEAVKDGAHCLVKIDGDEQHNPELIEDFVSPILNRDADFTKGNRFFYLEDLRQMPGVRLIGNACLSFATKFSSGYWNIFDPTNGYLAVHSLVFQALPHEKIDKRYFFESDLLFRLYTIRAKIVEIPMHAVYGEEESSLSPSKLILPFLWRHMINSLKRIFYSYFLRNFSLASIYLFLGLFFCLFGGAMGLSAWLQYFGSETGAPIGQVALPGLMILIGVQMILGFLNYDLSSIPSSVIHSHLSWLKNKTRGSGRAGLNDTLE